MISRRQAFLDPDAVGEVYRGATRFQIKGAGELRDGEAALGGEAGYGYRLAHVMVRKLNGLFDVRYWGGSRVHGLI